MNIDQILRVDKHFSNSLLESCGLFAMDAGASLFGQSLPISTSGQLSATLQSKSLLPSSPSTLSPLALTSLPATTTNHPFSFGVNSNSFAKSSLMPNLNGGTSFLESLLMKQNMDQAQLNKLALNLTQSTTATTTNASNVTTPATTIHNFGNDSFSMLATSLHQQLLAASQLNAIKLPLNSISSNNNTNHNSTASALLRSPNSFDFGAFLQPKSEVGTFQSDPDAGSTTIMSNGNLTLSAGSAQKASTSVPMGRDPASSDRCSQPNSPSSMTSSNGWNDAIGSSGNDLVATDNGTSTSTTAYPTRLNDFNKQVFKEYQEWALRTYGDAAKTKTVTKKKYERIVNILNGQESQCLENSKFRFWVKSKGFRLCRKEPTLHSIARSDLEAADLNHRDSNLANEDSLEEVSETMNHSEQESQDFEEEVLYVPCPKASVSERLNAL